MSRAPHAAPELVRNQPAASWWRRTKALRRSPLRLVRRRSQRPPEDTSLVATFDSEAELRSAVERLKKAGAELQDLFAPYPFHDADRLLGLKPSRLPWGTFVAAVTGASLGFGFQLWTSTVGWPLNVGGKPNNSAPAFLPVTFEVTILLAGLTTALILIWRSGLFPWKRNHVIDGVTDDRFALLLVPPEGEAKARELRQLLVELGASPKAPEAK